MSNHGGSYLLNQVLKMMDNYHMLEKLDSGHRQKLIKDIVKMAYHEYDCNAGEILEGIGKRYQICYMCLSQKDLGDDEICADCM